MSSDKIHMQKKWAHFYSLIDASGDGIIELEDFLIVAQRLHHLCSLKGKKIDYETLKWESRRLFDNLRIEMHLASTPAIRLWNWFDWLNEITFKGQDSDVYRAFTIALCREIFEVCDQNNDGFISRSELNEFFLVFNISNDVAIRTFQKLDHNQDGMINKHELLFGIRQFFIGTEPSDYDELFGPVSDEYSLSYRPVD